MSGSIPTLCYAAEEEAAAAHLTHEEALRMLQEEPPEPENIVATFVRPGDKDESGSDL